ncbi:GAF domain-containing protein [Ottowia sp. GY511]|uniref:GAF domain-containing protein n=1 Tax=Ottowia flava TaxID=2675430 RepID=A0ABW4KSY5_9BURK|nr:GAF domain-containing protein [Ottowia sp. GY511]TXK31010.1 GAF domain-containing protein [Ottowia sp. GY511]
MRALPTVMAGAPKSLGEGTAASIQAHGVLAGLDSEGLVTHLSANACELLGRLAPVLGERLRLEHVAGDAQLLASLSGPQSTNFFEADALRHRQVALNGRSFDLLVHRHPGPTLVEWEWCQQEPMRQELGPALHRIVQNLRRQDTAQALLEEAVRSVRAVTGLDRTMVYRFRREDVGGGGDVVAEACIPELPSFLGYSFPDEAIPQATRRLCQLNAVRLIADAHSQPVPVFNLDPSARPLDLTYAVLRSPEPLPVDYLRQSDMGAAMTLPLMIEDQLWGVIISHHRTRLQVPYPTRSICAVLAELVSAQLQSQLAQDRIARERQLEHLRSTLLDQMQSAVETAQVLSARSQEIAEAFGAEAMLVSHQSSLHAHGPVTPQLWSTLRRWLSESGVDDGHAYATDSLALAAPALADELGGWAGLLSISYDASSQGRILLLRRERLDTVTWGAWPVLSERARTLHLVQSSEETLRGFSKPWAHEDVAALDALGADLRRLVAARVAEMHRYRDAVSAMLHARPDTAASPGTDEPEGRFERVLHQAMELSLLRQGVRPLIRTPVDLGELLAERIGAAQQRHHGTSIYFETPAVHEGEAAIAVQGEPDRLARLFDGLLENAVRHGHAGESVVVRVGREGSEALVEISNISPPIAESVVAALFSPTVPAAIDDSRSGLGFGLYVGQTIALAHGGTLTYTYDDPFVTMAVRLPLEPAP